MKKLILPICLGLTLILVGCSASPEKKAKNLISQHLKESLHDWSSYESVKFGSLDSVYTSPMDVPEYTEIFNTLWDLDDKMKRAHKEMKEYESMGYLFKEEMLTASQKVIKYANELKELQPKTDSIFSVFVPEFNGWSMRHSFRANNLAGNKGINHNEYYFNKDLTEIIGVENVGE